MTLTVKRIAVVAAVVAANLILFSCSSGPAAPQKGTPGFYWQAARESWARADYLKTVENLDNIVKTDNEYTAQARPWLLVVTSGMAKGYIDMADYFEGGARINKADPLTFRKQVSKARGSAGRLAMRFAEVFNDFQKSKDDPVSLAFAFPTGSPGFPPVLNKIGNGILPQSTEIDAAEKGSVQRAVLLNTCKAAGSADDVAKVQAQFKAGEVKVPRSVFITAMAGAMLEEAQLFSRNKLDEPDKLQILCQRAQDALKALPESKEVKELGVKIQNTLKKNKA